MILCVFAPFASLREILATKPKTHSWSNSLVVFSVTLGGWANSFVRTCCRPKSGMGMLAAGGNEPRAGAGPKDEVWSDEGGTDD